jgi:hypothetical protein
LSKSPKLQNPQKQKQPHARKGTQKNQRSKTRTQATRNAKNPKQKKKKGPKRKTTDSAIAFFPPQRKKQQNPPAPITSV